MASYCPHKFNHAVTSGFSGTLKAAISIRPEVREAWMRSELHTGRTRTLGGSVKSHALIKDGMIEVTEKFSKFFPGVGLSRDITI